MTSNSHSKNIQEIKYYHVKAFWSILLVLFPSNGFKLSSMVSIVAAWLPFVNSKTLKYQARERPLRGNYVKLQYLITNSKAF